MLDSTWSYRYEEAHWARRATESVERVRTRLTLRDLPFDERAAVFLRASKVVGLNVYNDSNESLGSINDLLLDKTGNIKGVVVGVGGFLGVGEHLVAVNFDKIKFVDEPVVTTSAANSSTTGSSGMTGTNPSTSNGMTTGSAPATPAASRTNPWYPDHALLSTTKDELKAMPEFKYSTQ